MKYIKYLAISLITLSLTACSTQPKQYEYKNGVMGENATAETPKESVSIIKDGVVTQTKDKPTRTPLEGLTDKEKATVTVVDYFYQHLMNSEYDQVDKLVVPEKVKKNSYGDYYKKKLKDNNITLLDFTVDRLTDKDDTFIIEVDVKQVVDKQVITYRDEVTLKLVDSVWLIDTIETEVKQAT